MKNFILLSLISISTVLFGQYSNKPFERKVFIENNGQFKNTLPKEYQDFEYCVDNGTQILFKNNELIYHFVDNHMDEWMEEEKREHEKGGFKSEEEEEREREKFKPTHQYIKMKWLGANPNAKIEVVDLDEAKYGYGVDWEDTKKGHTVFCKGYQKLYIRNLYQGIDAEYIFNSESDIKYNLIVSNTGNISDVRFKYEGTNTVLDKGQLIVQTLSGEMIEYTPVSYITKTKLAIQC